MSLSSRIPNPNNENHQQSLKQKLMNSVLAEFEQLNESDMSGNRDRLREKLISVMKSSSHVKDGNYDDELLQALYTTVIDDLIGYGPLQSLVDDEEITEILVLASNNIFVRRHGGERESTSVQFDDDNHVLRIADRLVAGFSKHVMMNRWIRVCLPTGWIVHIDWFTKDGLNDVGWRTLQLCRMRPPMLTKEEHIEQDVLTEEMLSYLQEAVTTGKRIIVGGTDANATGGLLYLLSGLMEIHTFAIAIEDVYKIALANDGIVKMQLPQRPYADTRQLAMHEADVTDFIPQVLELRPDTLLVSEVNRLTCAPIVWAQIPYMGTLHSRSLQNSVQWLAHHGGLRDATHLVNCTDIIIQVEAPYRVSAICEIDASTPTAFRTIFTK